MWTHNAVQFKIHAVNNCGPGIYWGSRGLRESINFISANRIYRKIYCIELSKAFMIEHLWALLMILEEFFLIAFLECWIFIYLKHFKHTFSRQLSTYIMAKNTYSQMTLQVQLPRKYKIIKCLFIKNIKLSLGEFPQLLQDKASELYIFNLKKLENSSKENFMFL